MTTPLYVRITEGIDDQENVSIVVAENETFQFGALGWSGGLPHVDLYRASGERVRFDLEYFKKVAVAVDHIDFQPQRKPLFLENPLVRAAYLRAGKSEAERLLEVLAERDAVKLKLMEALVYMTLAADKIEMTSISRTDFAQDVRRFVRDECGTHKHSPRFKTGDRFRSNTSPETIIRLDAPAIHGGKPAWDSTFVADPNPVVIGLTMRLTDAYLLAGFTEVPA